VIPMSEKISNLFNSIQYSEQFVFRLLKRNISDLELKVFLEISDSQVQQLKNYYKIQSKMQKN
jgi:hypothetical protein